MKISPATLRDEAARSGFRSEIVEKVLHLLNLLEGFRRHPFLKTRFALKGGTALNLFVFDLPRLSIDIDINYIGAVERAAMLAERPNFERAIQDVCHREDMTLARLPAGHAGGKWRLRYASAVTETANLEVDVTYMARVPLWKPVIADSQPLGTATATAIPLLDIHELAAGKLRALLSRHASRDLFDARELLTNQEFDATRLRLGFVIYGGMSRRDWRTVSIDDVAFDEAELRHQLLPVMRTNPTISDADHKAWATRLVDECRSALSAVLPLAENERAFLDRLVEHGEIDPTLLTDDEDLKERIATHPGLKWKALNVRQHKGRQTAEPDELQA